MAKKKPDRGPIELAGIKTGGCSADGNAVFFEFESQDDKTFKFSYPHEAVGEIMFKLLSLADISHKLRGSPIALDTSQGSIIRLRSQTLTDCTIRGSKQGLVLVLLCGPLQYQLALSPEQRSILGERLIESRSEWEARQRPN